LRNRVYRDLASERMAYAATRDATHRDGERYVWGGDDGIPASGRQTAAIIGTCVGFCLLLVGLAYLVWAGRNGNYVWQ
jgi:predicted cobalt transporter CbtA